MARSSRTAKIVDLPSWVPDYRATSRSFLGMSESFQQRTVGKGARNTFFKPEIPFLSDERALFCFGYRLGTVTAASRPQEDFLEGRDTFEAGAKVVYACLTRYPFTQETKADVAAATLTANSDASKELTQSLGLFWLRKLVDLYQQQKLTATESPGRHEEDVFAAMSTIEALGNRTKDGNLPTRRRLQTVLAQYADGRKQQRTIKQMILDSALFESSFRKHYAHRKLFHTDRFHLGIGSEAAQIGDESWFLTRSPASFILRRSNEGESTFTVIGHTYVHGLFGGTVVEDLGNETSLSVL